MLPLLAWMATIFIGQRTNSAALAAITTHLKKLGNRAYRMSPTDLVEQLEPVVARVADDRTWMPAHAGLWIRSDAAQLAASLGVNERQVNSLRDHTLGFREPTRRRTRSHA